MVWLARELRLARGERQDWLLSLPIFLLACEHTCWHAIEGGLLEVMAKLLVAMPNEYGMPILWALIGLGARRECRQAIRDAGLVPIVQNFALDVHKASLDPTVNGLANEVLLLLHNNSSGVNTT